MGQVGNGWNGGGRIGVEGEGQREWCIELRGGRSVSGWRGGREGEERVVGECVCVRGASYVLLT